MARRKADTGALEARVVRPSPALLAARDAVDRLIESWDDRVADGIAADNLFLDRPRERRIRDFQDLRVGHGRCRPDGEVIAENLLRGRWTLACERGRVDVAITLAPTEPPRPSLSPPRDRLSDGGDATLRGRERAARGFPAQGHRVSSSTMLHIACTRRHNMSDDRSVPSRGRSFHPARSIWSLVAGLVILAGSACVQVKPATDTSNPEVNPVGPSSGEDDRRSPSSTTPSSTVPASPGTSATPVAYVPDLQPVFASDCVRCHSNGSARGGYSMSSYQAVLRDVRAGDASSRLVTKTRPGGSMYPYFSGDRTAKSNMVYNWVVVYGALQQR